MSQRLTPEVLVYDTVTAADPQLSPDGRFIAFVSDRVQGSSALLVLPMQAPGEARELTRHRQALGHLAWSPDSARIAYTTTFDPDNPDEQPPPEGRAPKVRVTR